MTYAGLQAPCPRFDGIQSPPVLTENSKRCALTNLRGKSPAQLFPVNLRNRCSYRGEHLWTACFRRAMRILQPRSDFMKPTAPGLLAIELRFRLDNQHRARSVMDHSLDYRRDEPLPEGWPASRQDDQVDLRCVTFCEYLVCRSSQSHANGRVNSRVHLGVRQPLQISRSDAGQLLVNAAVGRLDVKLQGVEQDHRETRAQRDAVDQLKDLKRAVRNVNRQQDFLGFQRGPFTSGRSGTRA
jgi:hypothetical protein